MSKCLLAVQQPESITPAEAEPSQTMHTAIGIQFHHEQCNTPRFTMVMLYLARSEIITANTANDNNKFQFHHIYSKFDTAEI